MILVSLSPSKYRIKSFADLETLLEIWLRSLNETGDEGASTDHSDITWRDRNWLALQAASVAVMNSFNSADLAVFAKKHTNTEHAADAPLRSSKLIT